MINKEAGSDSIILTHKLLLTLTLAVSSAKDIDTALLTILQKICETTSWAAGDAWFIIDNDRITMRLSYCSENNSIDVKGFCSESNKIELRKGEGLPGEAWQHKNSIWVKNLQNLAVFPRRDLAMQNGIKTGVAIPIPLNDEVIAVLAFYLTEESDVQKNFVEIVEAVAGQIGVLLKQKQTEEMLKNSELRFRSLMQSSPEAIFISDSTGKIILANPAAEKMFGYDKDELLGQPMEILMPEKYREQHRKGIERYLETRVPHVIGKSVELEALRKNQSVFPIELSVGTWNSNNVDYFSGIIRDISIRKEADQKIMQKQRDLEQFAYVASHDMKEPLRMISSYTKLLLRTCEPHLDEESKEFGGFIDEAVGRMQDLINDLLAYGKAGGEEAQKTTVDCALVVENVKSALRIKLDETETKISYNQLPKIKANASQITQLFQNLIENAIKFRRENTTPTIEINAKRKASFYEFAIADNGIGMEQKYEDRVFKIFQRLHTRKEYPGTGIGLAICKKIVENHGGTIWLRSAPNQGTTFYFTIQAGVN